MTSEELKKSLDSANNRLQYAHTVRGNVIHSENYMADAALFEATLAVAEYLRILVQLQMEGVKGDGK